MWQQDEALPQRELTLLPAARALLSGTALLGLRRGARNRRPALGSHGEEGLAAESCGGTALVKLVERQVASTGLG